MYVKIVIENFNVYLWKEKYERYKILYISELSKDISISIKDKSGKSLRIRRRSVKLLQRKSIFLLLHTSIFLEVYAYNDTIY